MANSRMLDRSGREFDLPTSPTRSATYVIASLPRTGSTFLSEALWSSGFGAPAEYLNPFVRAHLNERWGGLPLGEYVEQLRASRTTRNGVFGLKVHFAQLKSEILVWHRDPVALLGHPKWILLTRTDHVGQAVSLDIARRSGRWWGSQRRRRFLRYNSESIERRHREIRWQESGWEGFFLRSGIDPLRLTYEQLVFDPPGAVESVIRFVSGDGEHPITLPWTERSNDVRSDRWARRYRRATDPHGTPSG